MAYNPTIWVNGETPINDENLNKIENQLVAADEDLQNANEKIVNLEEDQESLQTQIDNNEKFARNNFANALKGNPSGTTIVLTDASPIEHEMKVNVSGVEDLTSITITTQGKNLAELRTGIGSYGGSVTTTVIVEGGDRVNCVSSLVKVQAGQSYAIKQKYYQNRNFRLFFYDKEPKIYVPNETINSDDYSIGGIYLTNTNNQKIVVPNNAEYMFIQWTNDYINYPVEEAQLEKGTTYTEYEPYREPVTYTPNADGSVDGVKSIYPTTIITTNNDNASIDIEYNRDLNKAFAELQNALISLGGNV